MNEGPYYYGSIQYVHLEVQHCCLWWQFLIAWECERSLMQIHPAPWFDPNRLGHFLSGEDALNAAGTGAMTVTNLVDLPSMKLEKRRAGHKERDVRDKATITAGGMRTWEGNQVHCVVICFSCSKPRCIFSNKNNADIANALRAFQQKLESVSERYLCGDLIFPNNDPLRLQVSNWKAVLQL